MVIMETPPPRAPGPSLNIFGTVTRPPKARASLEPLPFTLEQLRQALPPRLFQISMWKSWYYILKDLAQFAIVALTMYLILPWVAHTHIIVRATLWVLYAIAQGSTGFGIWVIGHECGHQGYFGVRHGVLNDTVGYIIHTLALTPYFSWKYTHAEHHRYTSLKEKDTAFPPKDYPGNYWAIGEFFPPIHSMLILGYLLLGWPGHITFNLEGHRYRYCTSHFLPNAVLFRDGQRWNIFWSDIGVAAVGYGLYYWAQQVGWQTVALWYGGPWVVTFGWLVLVTFLQHSDSRVIQYDDDEQWDFLKGALATVDRDYGIFNVWLHHITNYHVVHHIFSHMPFYNAEEATKILKPILKEHYLSDNRPLLRQLWDGWFAHQSSFFHSKIYKAKQEALRLKKQQEKEMKSK